MKKKTVYKKMIGVYNITHFAYAIPKFYPRYNTAKFPSRTGIFVRLDHYSLAGKKEISFTYKGQLYTIARHVASKNLIEMSFIPNHPVMVPIELWAVSEIPEHRIAVKWEIDSVRNVARVIEFKPEPEQLGFL